ncbi:MAG TPA: ABC transporter permease, partial [Roseiarcus sp.]|nr:ABC transporter permease [Roseiarcus sp.]
MSQASDTGRPAPQEFEKALAGAAATVASFDEQKLTFLQRLQRFLHVYPTTVPFVVLLLGLLLGVAVNPARFTAASNLSTVLT